MPHNIYIYIYIYTYIHIVYISFNKTIAEPIAAFAAKGPPTKDGTHFLGGYNHGGLQSGGLQ